MTHLTERVVEMNPAITVAVIAAIATAAGWIVSYILSSRAEQERLRHASRLSHIEKQLEFLYGPLAFLVLEGRRTFKDLLNTLGRSYIFAMNQQLPPNELEIWQFWVDHDLMPRNAAIKNLLSSNTHLVVGGRLPDSYVKFLDHYNSWYIQHQRWKEQQVAYSWHSKINWPREFEEDVLSTFGQLMREHETLIGIVGGTKAGSLAHTGRTPLAGLRRERIRLVVGRVSTVRPPDRR
jgi:hypothetical protein